MIVVFAVAIINYAVDFGADNDVAIDISDDSDLINIQSNLESNIVTYMSETNSSLEALYKSEISAGDETTVTGGQFKGGIRGAFNTVKNILNLGYKKIFGSEQGSSGKGIALTALISFLGVVALAYLWKIWAGKNPD